MACCIIRCIPRYFRYSYGSYQRSQESSRRVLFLQQISIFFWGKTKSLCIWLFQTPDKARNQFASSPNLSGVGKKEESTRLKGVGSVSTSNLATKESKISKLRRISPNLLRNSLKNDKDKQSSEISKSSKLTSKYFTFFNIGIATKLAGRSANC